MTAACMKKRLCTNLDNVQSTEAQDPVHSPDTLLKMCIEFVAQNLPLVDTFCGFPDLIGKEIFKTAEYHGKFDGTSATFSQEIALFTMEYGEEVLSQLNVSSCHLGINYFLESLMLFHHLTGVDLSACGLGDDHELLYHIGKMNCLRQISLKDNAMTDHGIQKMTTPMRMFMQSGTVLCTLDISENSNITEKCLKYLKCYPRLESVEVTGTLIDKVADDFWEIRHPQNTSKYKVAVLTEGWAASVVTSWMSLAVVKSSTRSHQNTGAAKFYASRRREKIQSQMCPKNTRYDSLKRTILVRSRDCSKQLASNMSHTETCSNKCQFKKVQSNVPKNKRNQNVTPLSSSTTTSPQTIDELSGVPDDKTAIDIFKQYHTSLWSAMNSEHW